MKEKILLGYELKTGKEVDIFLSHLVVTGVTQLSGKTTTLEALISRSDFKAVAFKTKPGETGFAEGYIIRPYFVEKSDWQYVKSLMEATMKEKMRFETSWIIRASKGTKSLKEVRNNLENFLDNKKIRSLDQSVFTNLLAYLDLVIPSLEKTQFSKSIKLRKGVNIMDLEKLNEEVQHLVIRSVLDYILKNEKDTIIIIPEAWKFLPEQRGSPVKQVAEAFIRQGATNRNYLWIDSQDMAGVDKVILKQVANWVLGLQTERNEVQHTLDQIPLPNSLKPKTEEIMTLNIGHFIACNPKFVKKVYVMPSWLDAETAKSIALKELPVEAVMGKKRLKLKDVTKFDELTLETLRSESKKLSGIISKLEKENSQLKSKIENLEVRIKQTKTDNKLIKNYKILANKINKIKSIIESEQKIETLKIAEEIEEPPKNIISEKPFVQAVVQPSIQSVIGDPLQSPLVQKLPRMSKAIYSVLLQNSSGLTKAQIGLMTGYSYKSGSFSNAMSKLRVTGLLKQEGDKNFAVVG